LLYSTFKTRWLFDEAATVCEMSPLIDCRMPAMSSQHGFCVKD
jgi:hypothetical protein